MILRFCKKKEKFKKVFIDIEIPGRSFYFYEFEFCGLCVLKFYNPFLENKKICLEIYTNENMVTHWREPIFNFTKFKKQGIQAKTRQIKKKN